MDDAIFRIVSCNVAGEEVMEWTRKVKKEGLLRVRWDRWKNGPESGPHK